MQQENANEDSQISLSAFFSLEKSVRNQPINASKFYLTSDDIQNNVSFSLNDLDDNPMQKENSQQQLSEQKSKQKQRKDTKNYSKNYRKRHKEYVQSLKDLNQKYQKKIEQLSLKIDQMTQQIKCLKYGRQLSDNDFESMFLKQKKQSLKQLVNQSQQNKQSTWDKVRQFAAIYGIGGREKINLLNYYMSQIIDNLLIDHHKNFVLSGLNQFQITSAYAKVIYQKQVEICQIDPVAFTNLRKCLKKGMVESIKNFHKSGQQFYQSYVKLINRTIQIQNQFAYIKDAVQKSLDPEKYVTLLHWYEENKFCRQIQILRKQWYESFRQN